MTATTPAFDLTVSRVIPAEPQALYAIVTEVGRMGELSPETRSTQWVEGDGPVVGARFKGRNKLGWLSWTTIATVTEAEPGARFAFEISPPSRTTWTYTFEAVPGGTRVTESMRKDSDQPAPIRLLQRLAGVRDRREHLRAGMTTTLERLEAASR